MKFRSVLGLVGVGCLVGGITLLACGSDSSVFGDGTGDSGVGSSSGEPGSSSGQVFSGDGSVTGDNDGGGPASDASCASSKAEAVLEKRPVDVIVVVDNSGSMSGEITEVQSQINQNFANIIQASGLDYRVIVVSRYGAVEPGQSICVSSPLSNANCETIFPNGELPANGDAGKPAETSKFFHYNREIGSTNGWCQILDGFAKGDNSDGYTLHPNGYGELLRKNAFKTFIFITDDRVSCSDNTIKTEDGGNIAVSYNDNGTVDGGFAAAAKFDQDIRNMSPSQFSDGDGGRNYVFHSIVALAPFADGGVTDAGDMNVHPSTGPVTTAICTPGAQNAGVGHQALSVMTGGLRYPTCTLSYTTIFQAIAKGVIKSSSIACDFAVPQPPPGQTLDLDTLAVQYTPGGGGPIQEFSKAASEAACGNNQFWLEGGATGTVHLCPSSCQKVKSDLESKVQVVSGCARINPTGNPPN